MWYCNKQLSQAREVYCKATAEETYAYRLSIHSEDRPTKGKSKKIFARGTSPLINYQYTAVMKGDKLAGISDVPLTTKAVAHYTGHFGKDGDVNTSDQHVLHLIYTMMVAADHEDKTITETRVSNKT